MSERRGIVFLDRDGTVNVEVDRLSSADQLELIPGAGKAIRRLNQAGFLTVVVTNQSIIARGECSEDGLMDIHAKLTSLLKLEGAHLDAIEFCPHHPDPGTAKANARFTILCACRKPNTGMIEGTLSRYSLSRENAWMIGDTTVDLKTAQNAGIRSVLVQTGYAGRDGRWSVRPDYEFPDLHEAAAFIVGQDAEGTEVGRKRS